MSTPRRRTWIALAFALAALLSSWSPLAAPFGLLTGLGAVVLAWRARGEGGWTARVALAVGLLAVASSAWVLARAVGTGPAVIQAPQAPALGERATSKGLDDAAEQSRAARRRAEQQAVPAPGPKTTN